jgi:hypothetical protein
VLQVLIEPQARACLGQHRGERGLAHLQRFPPQVVAIELQQVEREQKHGLIAPPVAQPVEGRHSVPVAGHRLAVEKERPDPQGTRSLPLKEFYDREHDELWKWDVDNRTFLKCGQHVIIFEDRKPYKQAADFRITIFNHYIGGFRYRRPEREAREPVIIPELRYTYASGAVTFGGKPCKAVTFTPDHKKPLPSWLKVPE